MKTICVFGSYNAKSVGDKALLIGLLSGLLNCIPEDIQIRILSDNDRDLTNLFSNYSWKDRVTVTPLFSKNLPGRIAQKVTSIVFPYLKLQKYSYRVRLFVSNKKRITSDSIGLIIGGGNLLMDIYPNWPFLMRDIARIFRGKNIPIVFAGVGALPIITSEGRRALKEALELADRVFVRDTVSGNIITNTMHIKTTVHPDFIFSLPVAFNNGEKGEEKYIALNVAPVFGPTWPEKDPKKYLTYFDTIVDAFQSIPTTSKILLFDTNYPTDRIASLQVMSRLMELGFQKSNILYDDRLMSVKEIVDLLSKASFTIATRLHAGLMALMANCPVTLLAYQPKVRNVFDLIGLSNCVVDLCDSVGLSNNIRLMATHPNSYRLTMDEIEALANTNQEVITKIVELFGVNTNMLKHF